MPKRCVMGVGEVHSVQELDWHLTESEGGKSMKNERGSYGIGGTYDFAKEQILGNESKGAFARGYYNSAFVILGREVECDSGQETKGEPGYQKA